MKLLKLIAIALILAGLLYSSEAAGQNIISGTVLDSAKHPVSNVTITYNLIRSTAILGFSQTNDKGYFMVTINSKEDSISLKLSHLSYTPQIHQLSNKTAEYNFSLSARSNTLKEVIITNVPIFKSNDTLNYNVKTFTSKEDKVIADVIKKLPGIEIENGQIKYQGKPIQEYLINGLNLLDEKYQLANNNLPADAVLNVQVIQNHQPIKILDSIIFSDRASLNLQLKNITITGSGKIATGFSPLLWDMNATPMIFNKSFQALHTFQSNNIGNNIASQLFTSVMTPNNPFTAQSDFSFPKEDFLSVRAATPPPFGQERWLNNHISLVNSNTIKKLRNETELKTSIAYYNDNTTETGQNITQFFVPGRTILVSEAIKNTVNTNDLRTGFTVTKNLPKVYFKDVFRAGFQWKKFNGSLLRNDTSNIDQFKHFNGYNFSNSLSSIIFSGKKLLSLSSVINYYEDPQSLSVIPGQFDAILNNGLPYAKVYQGVTFKNFDIDNAISMVRGFHQFSVGSKFGFKYQNQQLQSNIQTLYNLIEKPLEGNFLNNIRYSTSNLYVELLGQYNKGRLKMELALPGSLRNLNIRQKSSTQRVVFEPKLSVRYTFTPMLDATVVSKFNRVFGGITNLYEGYILNSYNNLQKFNSSITEAKIVENYLSLIYTNTTKSLFANFILTSKQQFRDFMFDDNVDSAGMKMITLKKQKNQWQTISAASDIGKYVSAIKTTVKLKGRSAINNSNQIINGTLSSIHQQEYAIGLNLNNSVLPFLNVGYDGSVQFINTQIDGKTLNPVKTQIHSGTLGMLPAKNQTLIVRTDYYTTNLPKHPHQTFVDVEYRFSMFRKKLNLELKLNNILNRNLFNTQYATSYSTSATSFQLRPRQFLIGTWFKF